MFSRAGFACFAALCARSARADALDSIVRAMSVADKVGQMTQVDISVMMTDGALDKRKLAYWLGEVRVGSILNSPLSGRDCAAAGPTGLSAHEWRAIVRGVQAEAQRLGLPPVLFGLDSVHGATYVRGATLFGHQIALAATFDRGIVEAVGAAQARDTIAAGVPWLFSPILDLATHPAFPRVYETFGEDPLVASQLGVAMIRGMQAETGDADLPRAAACMKHFFAYAHPANGHDRAPVSVHEGALRDSYLRPFTAAVREAGVLSAMNSYNELNGVPIVASRKWLRRVLRDELGFAGLLVTDWGEINNLHSFHHAAQSEEAAVLLALERTSIDMSMVPLDNSFSRHVLRLVRTGALPVGRVDESVSRVLALKERLGLFRSPVPSNETPLFSRVGKDGELALESARASVTLLLNRGLPPAPSAERVCGPVLLDAGATSSHDLPGGSFSRADVPDAAECRARCEAEAACAVWLFMGSWRASHPDWPICFLKSAAASISRGDDNARNAAGTCAPLPTPAVLPLDPARGARRRLLLTGPTSDSLVFQAGGWSVRWQGGCRDSDFEAGGETVRQALGRLLPDGVELVHTPGCTIDAPTHATATCGGPAELAAALDAALSADVAIVALGEENYTEKPGDIDDLALHAGQLELVRALAAHAPHVPIILVLISGRPRLLNGLPQLSSVVAVVWAGVPGPHGGTAIAEVLLGMTNPSGRLPLTYPALPNALGTHYQTHAARCSGSAGGYLSGGTTDCPVEFPFGHGLSYTRFEYSDADSAPARVLHPVRAPVHAALAPLPSCAPARGLSPARTPRAGALAGHVWRQPRGDEPRRARGQAHCPPLCDAAVPLVRRRTRAAAARWLQQRAAPAGRAEDRRAVGSDRPPLIPQRGDGGGGRVGRVHAPCAERRHAAATRRDRRCRGRRRRGAAWRRRTRGRVGV